MNDDSISRQAAIDAIRASAKKYTGFMEMGMYTDDDAVEAIEGLPSAEPLTAYVISDEDGNIKCSNCGSFECWGNYCMNCGAKMRGENNARFNQPTGGN